MLPQPVAPVSVGSLAPTNLIALWLAKRNHDKIKIKSRMLGATRVRCSVITNDPPCSNREARSNRNSRTDQAGQNRLCLK
jgi:hypothetical protein